MENNYIARFADGRLASIFYDKGNINYRIYENARWQKANVLIEEARSNFTANFSSGGELNIFAQNNSGSIILATMGKERVSSKIILVNKSESVYTILFCSMFTGNAMSLVYNIPTDEKKFKLIMQNLHENGKWDKPEEIDTFLSLGNNLFEAQYINKSHMLIFYRSQANIAGYRELTPSKFGDFINIQRHPENMQSYSFLTESDILHTLYISSNLFSSRLIYRRKSQSTFDPPIVIWEGQWLDNCLLNVINGEIHAFFQSGGTLYTSISSNGGESFSRPQAYKYKFCRTPVKATYISQKPMKSEDYVCANVYIDSLNPWDIQVLPDMVEGFYPYMEISAVSIKEEKPKKDEAESVDFSENELLKEKLEKTLSENNYQKAQIASLMQSLKDAESFDFSEVELLKEKLEKTSSESNHQKVQIAKLMQSLKDAENSDSSENDHLKEKLEKTLAENNYQKSQIAKLTQSLKESQNSGEIAKLKTENLELSEKIEKEAKKHKAAVGKYLKQIRKLEKELDDLKPIENSR